MHQHEIVGGTWIFAHYDEILSGHAIPLVEELLGTRADRSMIQPHLNRSLMKGFADETAEKVYHGLAELAEGKYASLCPWQMHAYALAARDAGQGSLVLDLKSRPEGYPVLWPINYRHNSISSSIGHIQRRFVRPLWVTAMSLVFLLSCLSACTGAMARGPVPLGRNLANGFILGIYEPQEEAKFSQVRRFAAAVGYKPNIVLNYSHWPQPFNSSFAKQVWAYGATPLIQIEPKDVVMSSIASGKWDAYLSQYARAVRNFGHTVIVSFAHEMNARWYSWGLGHVSPAVWVAAWRHVFRLFRDAGARNAIWLWTVNRLGPGIGGIRNWWPGSSYVTWIGIDGYYYFPKDTFASVFKSTIESVRSFTNKPIVLSEIAVGNFAGKAAKMPGLFTGIKRYHLRGLAWFDVPNPNPTTYHQNWREEGDPAAVRAFHKALAEIEKPADG